MMLLDVFVYFSRFVCTPVNPIFLYPKATDTKKKANKVIVIRNTEKNAPIQDSIKNKWLRSDIFGIFSGRLKIK